MCVSVRQAWTTGIEIREVFNSEIKMTCRVSSWVVPSRDFGVVVDEIRIPSCVKLHLPAWRERGLHGMLGLRRRPHLQCFLLD